MTLLYELNMYNMNKYFIEYLKKQIYVCFDGGDGFVNLKFDYNGNEYLFVAIVTKNNRLLSTFKRVLKLKDKNNALHSLLCMIIDQFHIDPKKDEKGEFKYNLLPEYDKNLKFERFPSIHIFTGDEDYDQVYSGKMIYNRIKKKLPMISFSFQCTKSYQDMNVIYVLVLYNMNKYFIEYPKHQLYTCFDGRDMFINLRFNHNDNEYLFIHIIRKNNEIYDGVKKLIKLKDKNSALYLTFSMVIDNYILHSREYDYGEFRYTLSLDRNLNLKKGEYSNISTHNDVRYYSTYSGKMIYNRLKKKLPVIYFYSFY